MTHSTTAAAEVELAAAQRARDHAQFIANACTAARIALTMALEHLRGEPSTLNDRLQGIARAVSDFEDEVTAVWQAESRRAAFAAQAVAAQTAPPFGLDQSHA